jgi:hypothetical protein
VTVVVLRVTEKKKYVGIVITSTVVPIAHIWYRFSSKQDWLHTWSPSKEIRYDYLRKICSIQAGITKWW